MRRLLAPVLLIALLLCGCAGATPAPTAAAAPATALPPGGGVDTSASIPTTGVATVKSITGMQALLLTSKPESASTKTGHVLPGQTGQILGMDVTGNWILVTIDNQTGWAPVQALDITVAR